MRYASDKSCRDNQNTHFVFHNVFFSPENRAVYEIRWKNVAQPVRPQMTIRRMRIVCWIPKATNTHSQYVLLIGFPLQQWLHESASMLRLYIHWLFCYKRNGVFTVRYGLYTYIPIQTYTAFSIQMVGGLQCLWIWINPAGTQWTPAIRSRPPPTQKNTDTIHFPTSLGPATRIFERPKTADAQIPGACSPWRLNFTRWHRGS